MIRHIFIAAVKDGVSEDIIEGIVKNLQALTEKYPTVRAGGNLGWFSDKTQVALTADFENKESWDAFINSPEHTEIVKNSMQYYNPDILFASQFDLKS